MTLLLWVKCSSRGKHSYQTFCVAVSFFCAAYFLHGNFFFAQQNFNHFCKWITADNFIQNLKRFRPTPMQNYKRMKELNRSVWVHSILSEIIWWLMFFIRAGACRELITLFSEFLTKFSWINWDFEIYLDQLTFFNFLLSRSMFFFSKTETDKKVKNSEFLNYFTLNFFSRSS